MFLTVGAMAPLANVHGSSLTLWKVTWLINLVVSHENASFSLSISMLFTERWYVTFFSLQNQFSAKDNEGQHEKSN
jgi:hypothetical protein